ncbi:MAG: winged helix-turn-helix transcriptional regulator [Firmicutes bacterium]|nr:winged helix-turn-helix transcriptional regulator [Bacillota bacterium]
MILKVVADETRFKMLQYLLERNFCVRALAKQLGLAEATISQHLKIMREAGLVRGEKRGYFTHYQVNREPLLELAETLRTLATIEQKRCLSRMEGCEVSDHCRGQ